MILKPQIIKHVLEAHRGVQDFFFTKNSICSYMKALSTHYKPVYIELKNNIELLRLCNFSKKFPIQTYGTQIFWGQNSPNLKNH